MENVINYLGCIMDAIDFIRLHEYYNSFDCLDNALHLIQEIDKSHILTDKEFNALCEIGCLASRFGRSTRREELQKND